MFDDIESPVSGITICAYGSKVENLCVEPDKIGLFVFEDLPTLEIIIKLSLLDPNSSDTSNTYKYINLWEDTVKIPAYEIAVPDQQLNSTSNIPIEQVVGGVWK